MSHSRGITVYITIIKVADAHIRFQLNSLNHFQNPFSTSLHSYRVCNFGTRGTLAGWLLVVYLFSKKSNIKHALFQHTIKLQRVCAVCSLEAQYCFRPRELTIWAPLRDLYLILGTPRKRSITHCQREWAKSSPTPDSMQRAKTPSRRSALDRRVRLRPGEPEPNAQTTMSTKECDAIDAISSPRIVRRGVVWWLSGWPFPPTGV